MGLSLFVILFAGALAGVIVLAGGVVLILATEYKKAGIALLAVGILVAICPLVTYILLVRGAG